jgi:hypothetical protein
MPPAQLAPSCDEPKANRPEPAVRYLYDKVFEVYSPILVKALRFSYEQKMDRALSENEGLCHKEQFSEDLKKRFARIFERLFNHGTWANPTYRAPFALQVVGHHVGHSL